MENMTCANITYDYSYRPLDIFYGILFLVVLFYSVVNTFCGLNRKGMNREMRNTFFCRQVMFLLIMLLTQSTTILRESITYIGSKHGEDIVTHFTDNNSDKFYLIQTLTMI